MSALVTVARLRRHAQERLARVDEGDALDVLERALVALGIATSVTSLDQDAIDDSIGAAFAAGASVAQVQEIVTLVSALGVHSLMATAATIERLAAAHGREVRTDLDEQQSAMWQRLVGEDPYWAGFRAAMPDFLEALIRLSPEQFEAFFSYCQLPWTARAVRAQTKELVALACDATPAHRFKPGFILHLENAIALGVGRRSIIEVLDMAAAAPIHRGFG